MTPPDHDNDNNKNKKDAQGGQTLPSWNWNQNLAAIPVRLHRNLSLMFQPS